MLKENQHIEFKSGFHEEAMEALVAFANTKGGKVVVGVSDKGVPVKKFEISSESIQKWLNEFKTKTQPSVIADAEIVEIEGHQVVEFSVQLQQCTYKQKIQVGTTILVLIKVCKIFHWKK